jgi:hypothetical protein
MMTLTVTSGIPWKLNEQVSLPLYILIFFSSILGFCIEWQSFRNFPFETRLSSHSTLNYAWELPYSNEFSYMSDLSLFRSFIYPCYALELFACYSSLSYHSFLHLFFSSYSFLLLESFTHVYNMS